MKQIIGREFRKYGGAIAMDCWMDSEKQTTFFGLTVHYISTIDEQLILNDRVLVIRELCASTTKSGEYLRSKIIEYLTEFELMDCIEKKLIFISDRGTNMVSSLRFFEHIHCFAHLMNNTLAKVFKKDPKKSFDEQSWSFRVVHIVTSIVKYFKSSALATRFCPRLKSNVSTRWNSVYNMLESVIYHWNLINEILHTSKKHLEDINSIALHELEILRDFLKPFKTSTDALEASHHPTLCHVIPHYLKIFNHLQPSPSDPNCFVESKKIALEYWVENVQKQLTINHKVALFLHPLMKGLKMQKPAERNEIWSQTKTLMHEFMPETSKHPQQEEALVNRSNFVDPTLALCMGDSEFDEEEDISDTQIELDDYKNLRIRGEDANVIDLLKWWHEQKQRFPRLYGVARFILSIPASSAAAERLFSLAGRLVKFRPNMRSDLVDEMLFLKSNIDLSRELVLQDELIDDAAIETVSLENSIDENCNDSEVQEVLLDIECER